MIVMSTRMDIVRTSRVYLVVCSTQYPEPPGPLDIEIPWDSEGRVATKLRQRTAAVCDWNIILDVAELGPEAGIITNDLRRRICDKIGHPFTPGRY